MDDCQRVRLAGLDTWIDKLSDKIPDPAAPASHSREVVGARRAPTSSD